jgi:hypothetical protein
MVQRVHNNFLECSVMLLYSLIQEMQFLATTLPSLSERAL